MTTYTIPAACLEALGSLKAEDPPVLYSHFADAHSARNAWHPSMGGEPFLSGAVLVLPASSAAVAAVLARAVGLRTLGLPVSWSRDARMLVTRPGGVFAGGPPMDLTERHFVEKIRARHLRARPGMESLWVIVPNIDKTKNAHHALALAAVWVARVKRYEAHATAMATLETVERYEKTNGWDVWEVT